jgi:hypothetical protein
MQNNPWYHKTSKDTHVETEKEKFPTSFFYFAFFSKLLFRPPKTSFAPLISAILSPIRLKIFLVGLQLISGGCFFIHADNSYPSKSVGFAKFLGCKKSIDFPLSAVFCFSCLKYLEFFNEKKTPPRNQWKSYQKNFQPDRTLNSPEKGGETIHRFLTLRSLEVDEDEVW